MDSALTTRSELGPRPDGGGEVSLLSNINKPLLVRSAESEILTDEVFCLCQVVVLGIFAPLSQAEETSEFHDLSHRIEGGRVRLLY